MTLGATRRDAMAVLVLLLAVPVRLGADAVVITRAMTATTVAEIFIDAEAIRVELEIGVSDLEGFRNILPDDLYERLGHEPAPYGQRQARFFERDLVIRSVGGAPLRGWVEEVTTRRRVGRDEITGEPLPVAPDDGTGKPVVFARLRYEMAGHPAVVTLTPPGFATGRAPVSIGFVAYHRGLPINDFRYLGAEETLRLDWDDPWYSRFDNRNLWRQYEAPMSAYLYVEPYEVRQEIVLRPKDLEPWVDLGLGDKEVITVDEQEELKQRVVEFLTGRNVVTIDGVPATGELDRVHFIYRTLRTSGVIDPPRDLDLTSATLGVIFYYPTSGLPQEASMTWDLFSDRVTRVPAAATDEAGAIPYFLTPDKATLTWTNFLKNPTMPGLVSVQDPPTLPRASLVLVGLVGASGLVWVGLRYGRRKVAGGLLSRSGLVTVGVVGLVTAVGVSLAIRASSLSSADSEAVVMALLTNVYGSFDYRDEGVIYDTLESSVAGDLLTQIYLETRRSLELENQGGARAKVRSIEMLQSNFEALNGETGFIAQCTWIVEGSVGHWGHVHQRINQYEARFVVKAIDGAWKITDLELLQEERL